jgi:hypothetical protein
MWLKKDFDPVTALRNISNGWRIVILDGHNSHCTFAFCLFAAQNRIIILCLVAHTTHRLQPCDVGVFGPLASSWKAQVMQIARTFTRITKYNLLGYYHAARTKAFSEATIKAAFRKTGIHPFDRNVIEDEAFEPAKNTSTQAAQPVPARLPALLGPLPRPDVSTCPNTPDTASSSSSVSVDSYGLVNVPAALPPSASIVALREHNTKLLEYANECRAQMEADYASKQLMDAENGRLRSELFAKKTRPPKQRIGGAGARHMTDSETLDALAMADWKAAITVVHTQLHSDEVFKAAKVASNTAWRDMMDVQKRAEKDALNAGKAIEREAKRAEVEAEKARVKAIADAEKARLKGIADAEKARVLAEKTAEKVAERVKKAEVVAKKKEAADTERERKKALAEERKAEVQAKKEAAAQTRAAAKPKAVNKRKRGDVEDEPAVDENTGPSYVPDAEPAEKRPRPAPRPINFARPADGGEVPNGGTRVFGMEVVNQDMSFIDPALR